MGIVWWSAHKLTWDCTYIDDQVDASGVGLMQAAGMEDGGSRIEDRGSRNEDRGSEIEDRKSSPSTWWQRWLKYREAQRKRPHNPGVWVIYFSLAALPLFGLGQSLIPAGDEGRRRYGFWLMIVYLGSGLGLLLTTSFLGLRRYLRQRSLPMPKTIAGAWLTTGGLLIAALLVGGALLPRPNAEYPLIDVENLVGSKERQASKFATKGDSPGKGEGRASTDRPPHNTQGSRDPGNKPDKEAGSQSQR